MKAVCGLDVHKDSVCLCILSEFGELIEKVLGVLTFQLEDMRDEGYQPIVELQIYNLSIFGNMNAVFLAALQDFFSNGSTADLIVVNTLKMGCHEGCPRGIVHGLHNIRNVHDDMSAYIEFVSTCVHNNNLRVPAVYISAYAAFYFCVRRDI